MSNSWDKYDFYAAETIWYNILRVAIPNTAIQANRSRGGSANKTPRFDVVLTTQPNQSQKFILIPGEQRAQLQPFNVWFYQLVFAVSTNRETNGDQHAEIVARGREALQYYKLNLSWQSDVFTITDSVEQPEILTVDDTGNIDTTTLTFTGMLCIKDGAWRA